MDRWAPVEANAFALQFAAEVAGLFPACVLLDRDTEVGSPDVLHLVTEDFARRLRDVHEANSCVLLPGFPFLGHAAACALRAIPNLLVFRPGDAVETAEAWQCALAAEESPSILALSRQGLEQFRLGDLSENMTVRGAYIAAGEADERQVTLMASGSEVGIALSAREMLAADGIAATVVSVPCMELFRQQDAAWQKMVLGTAPRIAIEAAIRQPWDRILGENDAFVGMDDFGASAPAGDLFPHFGITADAVVAAAKTRVA